MKRPPAIPPWAVVSARAELSYARGDYKTASANLWRARKWRYRVEQIRHFESLVLAQLDHIHAMQEILTGMGIPHDHIGPSFMVQMPTR